MGLFLSLSFLCIGDNSPSKVCYHHSAWEQQWLAQPSTYLVGLEALSLDHDVAQAAAGGGRGRDGVVVVAGGHGGHHLEGALCFIMAPRPLLIPLRFTKLNI